jgi:hypothetical protein
MLIPQELEKTIERAYTQMKAHPARALVPIHRQALYNLINLNDSLHERRSFKWLAIVTARYTLSIWQNTKLDNRSPEYLIKMAEGILNGKGSIDAANIEADKAWEQIEKLGTINNDRSINNRSFYVYVTAFEALMEVLGRDPFQDIVIDESSTDFDLDPWSSDTALWAVAAYAGQIGDLDSDTSKRQEFWEWWLQEAIPTAWNLSKSGMR